MSANNIKKTHNWLIHWLVKEHQSPNSLFCDFSRLSKEAGICDVLLIEGRSRVCAIIKALSQSAWSHSVLYIGKLDNIQNPLIHNLASKFVTAETKEQPLILEALFDKGVILSPLEKYKDEHIRICRPVNLCPDDAQKIMNNALKHLGKQYNARQIFDLLRFLLPIRLLPRRWLSTLFRYKKGSHTEEICSSIIAQAFGSVNFPIRPAFKIKNKTHLELTRRNPLLVTPSDFDYSPYFQIMKYPIYGCNEEDHYRDANWNTNNKIANSENEIVELEE